MTLIDRRKPRLFDHLPLMHCLHWEMAERPTSSEYVPTGHSPRQSSCDSRLLEVPSLPLGMGTRWGPLCFQRGSKSPVLRSQGRKLVALSSHTCQRGMLICKSERVHSRSDRCWHCSPQFHTHSLHRFQQTHLSHRIRVPAGSHRSAQCSKDQLRQCSAGCSAQAASDIGDEPVLIRTVRRDGIGLAQAPIADIRRSVYSPALGSATNYKSRSNTPLDRN